MSHETPVPLLAIIGRLSDDRRRSLDQDLGAHWAIKSWISGDPEEQLVSLAEMADAFLCGYEVSGLAQVNRALPHARNLKLLQISFAGYDWLDLGLVPKECAVCNASGHEIAIAEFVMAGLLEWEIRLSKIDRNFRSGSWADGGYGRDDLFHGEIYKKTLGLVGFGKIGQEIAKRAHAFDMRVIAVSRSRRERPEGLAWYDTVHRLPDLLRESDYVVINCSLNDETRGLIDKERLAFMRPGSVVVNVARGMVIDEEALFRALAAKQIAGAILDVWYRYPPFDGNLDAEARRNPMPSRFPFHDLENVIMTPHCSARTRETSARRWQIVIDNFNRFARGEELRNVVFRRH